MGVSGCARDCAEARSQDFGVIATENGWNLYVGGNGGYRPRHADLMVTDVDTATLVRTIDRVLMLYVFTADRLQRTASWLTAREGGLDALRAADIDDSLGRCADLDAAMARHVPTYADEWAEALADPERLARFASFVNAPGEPEPSIAFRERRGRSSRRRCWWRARRCRSCGRERLDAGVPGRAGAPGARGLRPRRRRPGRGLPHPRRDAARPRQPRPVQRGDGAVPRDRRQPGRPPGGVQPDVQAGVGPAERPVPGRPGGRRARARRAVRDGAVELAVRQPVRLPA